MIPLLAGQLARPTNDVIARIVSSGRTSSTSAMILGGVILFKADGRNSPPIHSDGKAASRQEVPGRARRASGLVRYPVARKMLLEASQGD
jgi:acyl dehydratase